MTYIPVAVPFAQAGSTALTALAHLQPSHLSFTPALPAATSTALVHIHSSYPQQHTHMSFTTALPPAALAVRAEGSVLSGYSLHLDLGSLNSGHSFTYRAGTWRVDASMAWRKVVLGVQGKGGGHGRE